MLKEGNTPPTGREFELNLMEKIKDPEFAGDIEALLRPDVDYDQQAAYSMFERFYIQKF